MHRGHRLDSPDWIAENADATQWTATISDLLGSLGLTVDQAGAVTHQYANLHGDVTCTASAADTTSSIGRWRFVAELLHRLDMRN